MLRGIDLANETAVRQFAKDSSIDAFKVQMTALVREYDADRTMFYNAGHIKPCTKASAQAYTHFELESLASGQ